jgi:hypothetical protein
MYLMETIEHASLDIIFLTRGCQCWASAFWIRMKGNQPPRSEVKICTYCNDWKCVKGRPADCTQLWPNSVCFAYPLGRWALCLFTYTLSERRCRGLLSRHRRSFRNLKAGLFKTHDISFKPVKFPSQIQWQFLIILISDTVLVQILCFWTLSIVFSLTKTSSCLFFKIQRFGDWILSSYSGKTYSFGPNR